MKAITRLLLIACIALPFAACEKQEAAAPAESAPVAAPANGDDNAWKAYLQDLIPRNMGNVTNQPFVYYLTSQTDPEFQAKYERQLDQVKIALGRGVVGGNLIAFASPESAKMAEIVEAGFKDVPADTMKGVRILFIGQATEKDRVAAAVAPSGADFVFVEAK